MSEETRGAIHRERFAKLQSEFAELVEMGNAGPEDFKTIAFRLMRAFETTRLKNHAEIDKLRQQIAFCEATQRACDMFENLLVGLIEAYKNDKKQGLATAVSQEGVVRPTAEEVLKTICACGCQDDEDRANCKCSCHRGIPCDNPVCVVCAAKKVQMEIVVPENSAKEIKSEVSIGESIVQPKRSSRRKKAD